MKPEIRQIIKGPNVVLKIQGKDDISQTLLNMIHQDDIDASDKLSEEINQALQSLLSYIPQIEDPPVLELSEYRALIAKIGIPAPTDEQIFNFSAFVSEAKSWYKHLPLLPPGEPFHFFFDPWAGMDRIIETGGKVTLLPRTENSFQSHYTCMTTEDYLSQFGLLSFSFGAGSHFFFISLSVELDDEKRTLVNGVLESNPAHPIVQLTQERALGLPTEVMQMGTVPVTGVIHRRAAHSWVWKMYLESMPNLHLFESWPSETGGWETFEKIVNRMDVLEQVDLHADVDEQLEALLAPERKRLQKEMITAMQRLRDLIY